MANPLLPKVQQGSFGELLVQIRLLQFDVQAAPPIKDSGNDLIAVRCYTFKAIQVKTTIEDKYQTGKVPEFYDLLAVVHLVGEITSIRLDDSRIFLIPRELVKKTSRRIDQLTEFQLSEEHIDKFFSRHCQHYGELA